MQVIVITALFYKVPQASTNVNKVIRIVVFGMLVFV